MNDIERQKNRAFIATLSCIAFIINTSAACVRYGMEARREASASSVQVASSQQPSSVVRAPLVQTVLLQPAVTYAPPASQASAPVVPPPQSASVSVVYVAPKASSAVSPPKPTMAAEAEPDGMKTMPVRSDDRRQAASDGELTPTVADAPEAQETLRETQEPPKEHPHLFDSFLYVTLSPVRILLKPIQPSQQTYQRPQPIKHRNSAKAKAAVASKASASPRANVGTPAASPNQVRYSVKK